MFGIHKPLRKRVVSLRTKLDDLSREVASQKSKIINLQRALSREKQRRIAANAVLDGTERLNPPEDESLDEYFNDLAMEWPTKITVYNVNSAIYGNNEPIPNVSVSPGSINKAGYMYDGKAANHVVKYDGKNWYFVRFEDHGNLLSGWIPERYLRDKPKIDLKF